MSQRVSFTIDDAAEGGRTVVTPRIDGASLVDLITAYETGKGFKPTGGYEGIPSHPDLVSQGYYLGEWLPDPAETVQQVDLLGCICGEVGCWPLTCRVEVYPDRVVWRDFRQEHRPERDYAPFGPFVFQRHDYDQALLDLKIKLETDGR